MKLNQNPKMITIMEDDLRKKIQVAIDCNPEMNMLVHGVFSVDDLEQKLEGDLGGCIGVGVQYNGAQRMSNDGKDGTFNAAGGQAGRSLKFMFSVILGVPSTDTTDERHDAATLLTVLRLAILGQPLEDGGRAQRTWDFVSESPQTSASTKTMLYYAQVWQVAMQNLGTAA